MSANWWSRRELPWTWACKYVVPSRLAHPRLSTSPAMARSSWPHQRSVGSGSIEWLGSWWQSRHRCDWPTPHRSSTRKRPSIPDCSSTRRRGSTSPMVHDSARNGDRNCGSRNCRIDHRSECWSTSRPLRNLASIRHWLGPHDDPTRSWPFPRRRANVLGSSANCRGNGVASWSTWCMARVVDSTMVRWSLSHTRMLAPPSLWIGCCRQRASMARAHPLRSYRWCWRISRWWFSCRPFLWPSRQQWRSTRSVRHHCGYLRECNQIMQRERKIERKKTNE